MGDAPAGKNGVTRVHVLTLSDESAHVRSLARSWAAGEVSIDDYRIIRSLTIEGMLSGEFAAAVLHDDPASKSSDAGAAQPDDDDDQDITAIGDHTVAEDDATDPNFEAVGEPPPPPAGLSAPRIALIAGAGLLLLGLILLITLA